MAHVRAMPSHLWAAPDGPSHFPLDGMEKVAIRVGEHMLDPRAATLVPQQTAGAGPRRRVSVGPQRDSDLHDSCHPPLPVAIGECRVQGFPVLRPLLPYIITGGLCRVCDALAADVPDCSVVDVSKAIVQLVQPGQQNVPFAGPLACNLQRVALGEGVVHCEHARDHALGEIVHLALGEREAARVEPPVCFSASHSLEHGE